MQDQRESEVIFDMASETERPILDGRDAVDLWLKGKGHWNKWVEDNPAYDIDFTGVDFAEHRSHPKMEQQDWPFAGFNFPNGNVSFYNAAFGDGYVNFNRAAFGNGNAASIKQPSARGMSALNI